MVVAVGLVVLLLSRSTRESWAHAFFAEDWHFTGLQVIVSTGVVLFFLLCVVVSRFLALEVNAWDFSLLYDLPLANAVRGRGFFSPLLNGSIFGDHARYILFALVPGYWAMPSPWWLLVGQAMAVALAAMVAFLLFRRLFADDVAAACVSLAFVLNNYTARLVQYVCHAEVLYPLWIFLLLLAYTARRPGLGAFAVILATSIKEDAFLLLVGVGVAMIVERRRRWGVATAAAGLAVSALGLFLVMPHWSGRSELAPWYSHYWEAYGATPIGAALGMLRSPARVIRDILRSGVPDLLESVAFLPLGGGRWFLAILPALIAYSAAGNPQLSHFGIYYAAPLLALLFYGAARGIRALSRRGDPIPAVMRRRTRLLALGLLIVCAFDGAGYRFFRPRRERAELPSVLRSLPDRMPVAVQGSLLPQLGYDSRVVPLTKNFSTTTAILIDPGTNPYPFSEKELNGLREHLGVTHERRVIGSSGSLFLFVPRRSAPAHS